jgi:hypothetical protein
VVGKPYGKSQILLAVASALSTLKPVVKKGGASGELV